MAWRTIILLLAMMWTASSAAFAAQTDTTDDPPATVDAALTQMSARAGIVFAGQVVAVRRQDASANRRGAGVVEVEFRVDQAVRGCSAGEDFILREWAGLWEGGVQRYRVGQRLLMLLHLPGAAGFSSPLNGMQGAIPIIPGTAVPAAASADPSQQQVEAGAPAALRVDMRWVETGVYRVVDPVMLRPPAAGPLRARAMDDPRRLAFEDRNLDRRSVVSAMPRPQAEVGIAATNILSSESQISDPGTRPLQAVLTLLAGNEGSKHEAR